MCLFHAITPVSIWRGCRCPVTSSLMRRILLPSQRLRSRDARAARRSDWYAARSQCVLLSGSLWDADEHCVDVLLVCHYLGLANDCCGVCLPQVGLLRPIDGNGEASTVPLKSVRLVELDKDVVYFAGNLVRRRHVFHGRH